MKEMKKVEEQQYVNSLLNNPMSNYKTYVLKKGENILVRLLSFCVGGCVGLVFYGGLFKIDGFATIYTHISNLIIFIIVGFLAMKFFLSLYKKSRLEKMQNKLKIQFRDMLESLSASLSAGSNIHNAFESVLNDLKMQYSEDDYIIREMKEIVDGIRQNIGIEEMLRDFGERSGNEDIINFADIFEICYQKGGNLNLVIHRIHNSISEKIAISDEIETKLTSNKMQHNVMSIMPIVVVALLRFTNESFATNFVTFTGVLVNTIAIGIFVAAYKYGKKIVDIDV